MVSRAAARLNLRIKLANSGRTSGAGSRWRQGYVTNLAACPDGTPVTPEFVIGSYHQLFEIEKSFRMSKSDLQARPVLPPQARLHRGPPHHRLRRPRRQPLDRTGWSIRKFVKTARRYRTIEIQAGRQTITAAHPIPDDLRQALDAINRDT
jgi:hypothetical protein